MSIYQSVLRKHKFSAKEMCEIKKNIDSVLGDLRKRLAKHSIKAEVMLGGSAAKGTILKGDFDCDVFVRFGKEYRKDDLSGLLEQSLKGLPYARIHGSRDYYQFELQGMKFEIIPVLSVTSQKDALNVTDMSPLHVAWIRKRIEKNPKLTDEIILAKVFCKSAGVYGAESFINGFSGHVIDVLIVYYGSFDSLIRNAVSWSKFKVIDIEGHGNGLNDSKISPLIVIDPIQPDRNAAAALALDKFEAFRERARQYLAKPSDAFFRQQKLGRKEIIAKIGKEHKDRPYLLLSAEPTDGSTDVAGTKLFKAFTFIKKHLAMHDFDIIDSGWTWDRKGAALFWFVLMSSEIAPEKEHMGPPLAQRSDVLLFKRKHHRTYEKGKRIYTKVKRPFTDIRNLALHLIGGEYLRERTKVMKIET